MIQPVAFFLWTHPLVVLVTLIVTAAVAVIAVSHEGEQP